MDRRNFLAGLGIGGSVSISGMAVAGASAADSGTAGIDGVAAELYEVVRTLPIDDAHCHPLTDRDAQTTPDLFLERISLAAFPAPSYFPDGVYSRWRDGDTATRQRLDHEYRISDTLQEINYHFGQSAFVRYLVKEMADFLGCAPNLDAVIEERNRRGASYWQYVTDLFEDVGIKNAMIDTGYAEGMDAAGIARFEEAIAPSRSRRILRVETIQSRLFAEEIPFDELVDRFTDAVRSGLDGDGNFGTKSWGMKSYLMPHIGVVKPLYDVEPARKSWDEYRSMRDDPPDDRETAQRAGQDVQRYLLTIALEECLARDMPMQFHAGDGEAPGIVLRNQDPYNLEEVVRFEREGVMRMPKIVPIHAGYPLVGKAAWLSHLYTNCYLELSIMTPFAHHGLLARYLQVMEAVPLSKILFGSDAYHLPELYWLAGRWGKRYLARALGVYVDNGVLTREEALAAARMILHENNRRLYNIDPPTTAVSAPASGAELPGRAGGPNAAPN